MLKKHEKDEKKTSRKKGNGYILQNMSPERRICVPLSMLMPSFGTHIVPQRETQPDCEDIVPRNAKSDELTMKPPPVTKKEEPDSETERHRKCTG